jgi:hypothetical protein
MICSAQAENRVNTRTRSPRYNTRKSNYRKRIDNLELTSTCVTLVPISRTSPLHSKPGINGVRGLSSNNP